MIASDIDKTIADAVREFRETVKNPQMLQEATAGLYEELLEELILGIAFDVHKSYKRGCLNLNPDETDVDIPEGEVFSQQTKKIECVCPNNCNRTIAAAKFAGHLQTCMGMGRNSSRLANQRNKDRDMTVSDDEADSDWTGDKKRKKKDNKNSSRKIKSKNQKNSDPSVDLAMINEPSNLSSSASYESLNDDKSRSQICGVVSEHTKKKCTRSVRCSQHTDEQRKAQLRSESDNFNIDIEGNEDSDAQSLRESLDMSSNNSSPADTASNTSNSSRKREKASRRKSKPMKKDSPHNSTMKKESPHSSRINLLCTLTIL